MAAPTPVTIATTLTTAIVTVDQSVITSCTTFTEYYKTTISATRGETIVISSPSPTATATSPPPPLPAPTFSTSTSVIPTTKIYPPPTFLNPTIISTTTLTEINIYLQTSNTIYSTVTLPLGSNHPPQSPLSSSSQPTPIADAPNQFLYIISPDPGPDSNNTTCNHNNTWDCWSTGAKAGLVIGVAFAAALLVWALVWCLKSCNAWVAHDWRWARGPSGMASGGGVDGGVVPTVNVVGPLVPAMASPYGYGVGNAAGGGGHPGWGYYH